jgi:hypothetical protein
MTPAIHFERFWCDSFWGLKSETDKIQGISCTFSGLKEYRYFQVKHSILNVRLLLFPSKLTGCPENIGIRSIPKKYGIS